MRRFLSITINREKTDGGLYRLSHYDPETLIKSGQYNGIDENGNVLTLLSTVQFASLINRLVRDGHCSNIKDTLPLQIFPSPAKFDEMRRKGFRSKKSSLVKTWKLASDGKPIIIFFGKKILFAKNGEVMIHQSFYNFKTHYAGFYLEEWYLRVKNRIKTKNLLKLSGIKNVKTKIL